MHCLPQQIGGRRHLKTLLLLLSLTAAAAAAPAAAPQQPVASHGPSGPARPAAHEVARVNGTSITSDRVDAALARLIPMESFHRNVSPEKMAALRQEALQALVDDELEYQLAVRQGIQVSDTDVQAAWTQVAEQYGGAPELEKALRGSGVTSAAARAEIRRSLMIREVYDREVTAKCRVSLDEAAHFFATNPERFVEPEQLRIFAITIGVDPSSNAAQWAAAKDRAEQARTELEAGASFADTVLKYSTDLNATTESDIGDMGFVHRGSLNDRFERVAKDLQVGQFSDVIETLYGYHIIRISGIRPAQKKSFDEVSAKLQKDLTDARCEERKEAWIAGLRADANVALVELAP